MHEDSERRFVVNKTYDEIRVGDFASLTRTLMPEDVKLFTVLTGDFNRSATDPGIRKAACSARSWPMACGAVR